MPGLSQLKKFNSDILALGNEIHARASRGEKPIIIPIPKTVRDVDDSEDFVLGIPESPESTMPALSSSEAEDFSDIIGTGKKGAAPKESAESSSTGVPDLSDLLNPVIPSASAGEAKMPDLSQFADEAERKIENAEHEGVSIADMNLDDLLGDMGGKEEEASDVLPEESASDVLSGKSSLNRGGVASETRSVPQDPFSLPPAEGFSSAVPDIPLPPDVHAHTVPDLPSLDELPPPEPEFASPSPPESSVKTAAAKVPAAPSREKIPKQKTPASSPAAVDSSVADWTDDFDTAGRTIDMNIELPEDMPEVENGDAAQDAEAASKSDVDRTSSFGKTSFEQKIADTSGEDKIPADSGADRTQENASDTGTNAGQLSSDTDANKKPISPLDADANRSPISFADAAQDGFELPDFDFASMVDDDGLSPAAGVPEQEKTSAGSSESSADAASVPREISLGGDAAEESGEVSSNTFAPHQAPESFDPDTFDFDFDMGDGEEGAAGETASGDEHSGDVPSEESGEEIIPIEHFDTSEMEGLDFTVKEPAKAEADKNDFELGLPGDLGDFEIPGFSDTAEVKTDKSGRIKLPMSDFRRAAEGGKAPKNTLTDAQYEKFLANLALYPLNVRLAVENLLVANEFTDDAQFEIVEKILNKAPARQVAASLEKMLDIAIPVPRDFERRTAAEYDAYKASLEYQLRNRIVPGIVLGLLSAAAVFGLIIFTLNFIWRPLNANGLYKQGYALIQADEYPQSEMLFNEAAGKQLQKKWFFKYARAYRERKQYLRAERMYRNILYYFNYDKEAGIEYARMECDDLANYEKAEEIARRSVLDYHVNDADGILLLGDIYLEWATEKDSAKFEEARKQYASLVQLYGQTDKYLARMMRYFVRTDNLREVLQLKDRFYPKAKSLDADDWTEMSGYLLDKLYGPLPPKDEYLRTKIEDVRDMLDRAVNANPSNPVAFYNLSRYFVQMHDSERAVRMLEHTVKLFEEKSQTLRRRDIYKQIDSYRLLGEQYVSGKEYLTAEEKYTDGISLYEREKENSGFAGNENIGKLYADSGDIDYFIRGDYEGAYNDYLSAIRTHYDTASLHYRVGFIQYSKNDLDGAVGSFIKAGAEKPEDDHLLLAMGNTLSLRDANYAAEGYYKQLVNNLDAEFAKKGIAFTQTKAAEDALTELYLKAANNFGVTLFRLARRTGNSRMNADAMVQLSVSMRAWDALTRNEATMVRLPGGNLAEQNMRYMSHPMPDYEPAIYTDIPKILTGEKELTQ